MKKAFFIAIIYMALLSGCDHIINQAATPTTHVETPSITSTVNPHLAVTNTPTALELLDKRTLFLFNEPVIHVISFLYEIQDSVRSDNKGKLASLVLYPITIHSINGEAADIYNEAEFIANYDEIATPKWKEIVLSQEPSDLSVNYQGVMLNRGELWFGPLCLDGQDCKQIKYFILSIVNDTPW